MHGEHSSLKLLLSLLLGLLFTAMGTVSALNFFGIPISLGFIDFLLSATIIEISLVVAGILLFLDSFSVRTQMGLVKWSSILIALLLAVIGAVPLMIENRFLDFLPFLLQITIPHMVLSIVLAFYGLYLLFTVVQLYKAKAMGFY